MNYQIIATLGPSSDTESLWQEMLAAGVTGFRLNTSHLTLAQLERWLARLDAFGVHVPVVLDLQGSKWRLGEFPTCTVTAGERVTLICASETDQPGLLPVPHPDFFWAAAVSSGEIVLNDARVRLQVESATADTMTARVMTGYTLSARKGITYTHSIYRQESLSERDQAIVDRSHGVEFIQFALSYVKDAVEMEKYRMQFGATTHLIAKLERQPAVDEAQAIADPADELWLCRGDLGAEVGIAAMAELTARFSRQLKSLPASALLAGQVLEHLTSQPTPTRSEVCHLYDALHAGYRGVVLSDETAIGRYPLESCRAAALFCANVDRAG